MSLGSEHCIAPRKQTEKLRYLPTSSYNSGMGDQDLNQGLADPKVDLHSSSSPFLVSLEQLN